MYRGINDFKKGYQPRTNIVMDEKGDLVRDYHGIVAGWSSQFSQLLNDHGVYDVRQTEIHTPEPLVPESSVFEVEMASEKLKLKNHHVLIKSQQDLLKQLVEKFALRSTHLLILFGIRSNCLRSGRSRSLYLLIRMVIKRTEVISLLSTTYKVLSTILLSWLTPYAEEITGGSSMWISTPQVNY